MLNNMTRRTLEMESAMKVAMARRRPIGAAATNVLGGDLVLGALGIVREEMER
jgi:hypothetical protein